MSCWLFFSKENNKHSNTIIYTSKFTFNIKCNPFCKLKDWFYVCKDHRENMLWKFTVEIRGKVWEIVLKVYCKFIFNFILIFFKFLHKSWIKSEINNHKYKSRKDNEKDLNENSSTTKNFLLFLVGKFFKDEGKIHQTEIIVKCFHLWPTLNLTLKQINLI